LLYDKPSAASIVSAASSLVSADTVFSNLMGRVFLSKADITELEETFVHDAIRSGWVAPLGPHVDAFEAEIAERVGVASALALSSGTAGLHLALLGVGASPGTAVLCSTMTFAASANAIAYTGASPVFVDAEVSDGNVDHALLLHAVDTLHSEGGSIAAVLVVDLFGRCAEYDAICAGLAEREVPIVEDAAESLGASFRGRAAGSFGRAAVLSFNGNKIMTTSGGGMLLSNDTGFIERARYLSTQARQPVPWYEHTEIGYNYRLSNVLAALGRAQLSRLDAMIARRRRIRQRYVERLNGVPGVRFLGQSAERSDREDNCWLTCLQVEPGVAPMSADELIAVLASEDIEARHLWKPMHLQPVFAAERCFLTGQAERLFTHGLALPSGSSLTDDEVDRVLHVLTSTLADQ
jgi:dTDP-4-amino-4,6-dideoxygalactose transaminase